MISNLHKLCGINNAINDHKRRHNAELPFSLMVTPHMDPLRSVNARWHRLKENTYILENIIKSDSAK